MSDTLDRNNPFMENLEDSNSGDPKVEALIEDKQKEGKKEAHNRTSPLDPTSGSHLDLLASANTETPLTTVESDIGNIPLPNEHRNDNLDQGEPSTPILQVKPNIFLDSIISKLTDQEKYESSERKGTVENVEESGPTVFENSDIPESFNYEEPQSSSIDEPSFEANSTRSLIVENCQLQDKKISNVRSVKPKISNVTMRKDEVTFPFPIVHYRAAFMLSMKDQSCYKTMLRNPERLGRFFKCMASRCSFSCHSGKGFLEHLNTHVKEYRSCSLIPDLKTIPTYGENIETVTFPDFCLCSYCPAGFYSPEKLIQHVFGIHGRSNFQCSECFFRGRSKKGLELHTKIDHFEKAHMVECPEVSVDLPLEPVKPEQITILQIPRYHCAATDCSFTCIHKDSFVTHMSESHREVKDFHCHVCKETVVCESEDCVEYFQHMTCHAIGFFQCAYCRWGCGLSTDMLFHLCLVHPSLTGKVIIRSSAHSKEGCENDKLLIKFLAPWEQHGYAKTLTIDVKKDFWELFLQIQVFESDLKSGEDVSFDPCHFKNATVIITELQI